MILCGGLAYKTEQMAHPLPVAWGPRASQAAFAVAIWQCGLVACASCAVPACDLVCSEFNTSLVAGHNDDCVPSGYFCETWVTLHWWDSVWN